MSIFNGAHNIAVNNSQFIDNSSNGPSGIDILLEASAPEAAYDSGARADAPRCFPGTREPCIEDIVQWAIPASDKSPLPLYWLGGEAEVGKSAIAQTSAEQINESGLLGASFFFSTHGANKPNTFFPSIAYQLSSRFANYRELLDREILRDKTIIHKTMEPQFRGLIVNPLVELERQGKGIGKRIAIIVDGLNECEGVDARCDIIEIIAKSAREGTTPLCWAFFSRPETHIESIFFQQGVAAICRVTNILVSCNAVTGQKVPSSGLQKAFTDKVLLSRLCGANGDIVVYLRNVFNNLLRHHNIVVKSRWPSDRSLRMIMEAANGNFIYAETVYRFIAQPEWVTLDEPLQAVLTVIMGVNAKRSSHSGSTSSSHFAQLDALYLFLLRRIPQEKLPSVHLLLTYLCLVRHYEGAMAIANLLRLSRADIHAICTRLSAVLNFDRESSSLEGYLDKNWDIDSPFYNIWNPDGFGKTAKNMMDRCGGRIEFYDNSFEQFLADQARSCEFCVTSTTAYNSLFENFQRLMLEYEKAYDFRESDSRSSLSYPYGNELGNSFMNVWVYNRACSDNIWLADKPELGFEWQKKLAMGDFRKQLYIKGLMFQKSRVTHGWINYQPSLLKYVHGTRLGRVGWEKQLSPDEFSSLVTTLKEASHLCISGYLLTMNAQKTVEKEQEAGIIRPYSPERSLSSLIFRKKTRDSVERGLYQIGHGSKAIFWFWEINHDERYYREFRTADYMEGKMLFRAERFDLW